MEEDLMVSPYNEEGLKNGHCFPEFVTIYDTTLRDGEQMPGVSFTPVQKSDLAFTLDEMKIPQIELGFPAVSEQEASTIKEITSQGLNAKSLALCRILRSEVDLCAECGVDTVLLFIASSDLHMKYKLKKDEEQLKQCVETVVSYAKDRGLEVSFSTEDTTRSRMEIVHNLNRTAVDAGATRIGITDTVGCANPEAISYIVKEVKKELPADITLGLHLHNDYGLALANAYSGLKSGANAIATTVCGLGERAGNVPLEEFVVGLKYLYGRDLGVDISQFTSLAKKVHDYVNIPLPPRSPLVGENAFTHESGIHVAATLNHPRTYESLSPKLIGNTRRLLLGKHSGKATIENKLEQNGLNIPQEQIAMILRQIKILGEDKGQVTDEEFWKIVEMVQK